MGFDQYHEPPEELPAQTRTFARLCASLTEEAEAIGWYEQRLAVESDPEAHAIMADAQSEEFKHFSQDLEALLRRSPLWRTLAQGILFKEGDIVEHAEEIEEEAIHGGGGDESGALGIGSLKGKTRLNHLLRSVAPITEDGWEEIDGEAKERLEVALAARKLVDFSGPHGWEYSATNLGRTEAVTASPAEGVDVERRRVLPLVELRADFTISRAELRAGERGAVDVDYGALDDAARRIARAENVAVMHGFDGDGITEASSHDAIALSDDFDQYPGDVAKALELMRREGVGGPFGLALGPKCYTGVIESTEHGGYLVLDHLSKILDGPVVWAPGVEGAVVLSLRGGDFLFESGQDLSVGYSGHDDDEVRLYLEESFSFRVATPEAAVALTVG